MQNISAPLVSVCRRSSLYGVAFNDAHYTVSNNGVKCPIYTIWRGMITRCYSKKYKTSKPTYQNCYVCDEWLYFSNFHRWAIKQDWQGKQLDKDIISPGNKVYSPDTCLFVDNRVNMCLILKKAGSHSSEYAGVMKVGNRYIAQMSEDGMRRRIASFVNEKDAAKCYLYAKADRVLRLSQEYKNEQKLSDGLYRHYLLLQQKAESI